MSFDENLVNKIFRKGVPALMYGFNPGSLEKMVEGLEYNPLGILLVNQVLKEDLMIYTENGNLILEDYLTWDKEKYEDPVDQCDMISQSNVEILNMAFEGINVKERKMDQAFFNLYMGTAKFIDALCEKIVPWALTHKFVGEVYEDAYGEEEE